MSRSTFLVPVLDQWMIHAPLHGLTALLNDEERRAFCGETEVPPSGRVRALRSKFLSPPERFPGAMEGEVCPSFLGIIPTRACNIGCVYCNFGGPTAKPLHMDPRIAVAAVDWMAERLVQAGREQFYVHFFGGEPFVSPEIIDIVVHRTRLVSAERGLVPYFDASTNGVFDAVRCSFVGDYFGGVVLSFDGPPEFHDRNRPAFGGRPTFKVVERTAKRLSNLPLDLCLRICITQDSVNHMEEMVAWMCDSFKPSYVNFEPLTPGELPERAGLQIPDPFDFAVNCVRAYRAAEARGVKAVYAAAEIDEARISFCPVGSDALIVSLDGRVSACYLLPEDWQRRGLDLDLGKVHTNGTVDIDFEALTRARRLPFDKPRCDACFCQWSCAGGCHVNQTYPGASLEYDAFCIQTRIVTVCRLLNKLGRDDVTDQLLANREAMEALARSWVDLPEHRERGEGKPAFAQEQSA